MGRDKAGADPEEKVVNESIVPTEKELEDFFTVYALFFDEDGGLDLKRRKDGRDIDLFVKKMSSGLTPKESVATIEANQEGAKLYEFFADNQDDFMEIFLGTYEGRARSFIAAREPKIRALILPYIEENIALIWGMGYCYGLWGRALNYGLSVPPYEWQEEAGYNRYTPIEKLSKKDREALRLTALDVYYSSLDILSELRKYGTRLGSLIEKEKVVLYPKEGYSIEDLAKMHTHEKLEIRYTEDDIRNMWYFDAEVFLPNILNRLDTAIFYGFRYPGNEYEEYLRTLDVKKDWIYEDEEPDKKPEDRTGEASYETIVARYKE